MQPMLLGVGYAPIDKVGPLVQRQRRCRCIVRAETACQMPTLTLLNLPSRDVEVNQQIPLFRDVCRTCSVQHDETLGACDFAAQIRSLHRIEERVQLPGIHPAEDRIVSKPGLQKSCNRLFRFQRGFRGKEGFGA